MAIEAAFMVPHPPLIVPAVGQGGEEQIRETSEAYDTVARQIAQIEPETIIIATPHSVMYQDYFHISPGSTAHGDLGAFRAPQVSFDETYDRRAVNVDVKNDKNLYMAALKRNIPNFSCKEGYFYMKNGYTQDEWAEKGILLSEDVVDYLTKDIIKRILNVSIWKSGAYFKFDSLVIKYFGENGEETVEITSDNIDDFKFIPVGKYNEADEEKVKANLQMHSKLIAEQVKKNQKAKKSKSSKKETETEE